MQEANSPSLVPIHLDNTLVYVDRIKPSYGGIPTTDLIQQYSRPEKKQKPKFLSSIHWEKEKLQGLTTNAEKTIGKADITSVLGLKWIPHTPQTVYNLHLTQPLPPSIKIGNSSYDPILVIQILQEILHKQIITKYGTVLKRMINNCFSIPVIAPTEALAVLVILGKGKAYCLAPRIQD
jgi:hypothetical protein